MSACRFSKSIAARIVLCGLSLGIPGLCWAEEPGSKPTSLYGVKLESIRKVIEMTIQQNPVTEQSIRQAIEQGKEFGTYLWTLLLTSPLYHEEAETDWVAYYGRSHRYKPVFVAPKMEFASPPPGTGSYPPPSYPQPMI